MTPADDALQDLQLRFPEWRPWLAVIQEVLHETGDSRWDAFVPGCPGIHASEIPLLADANILLEKSLLRPWFERLVRVAYLSGTAKLVTLKTALSANVDLISLFKASLQQDSECIKQTATSLSADAEGFQAVAALIPVPFLQACNRRWAGTPVGWTEGYCPVCGSWPAFAEMRGIERNRYLRCGRCGSEWWAQILLCPYCSNSDHEHQASFVPESNSKWSINACRRCLGYVKIFTTLQGSPPGRIILDDLTSVEMDMAAAEQGYRRPQGIGYVFNLSVSERGAMRERFF